MKSVTRDKCYALLTRTLLPLRGAINQWKLVLPVNDRLGGLRNSERKAVRFVTAVFAMSLVCCSFPAIAVAGGAETNQGHFQNAQTYFSKYGDDGCLQTDTMIQAGDSEYHGPSWKESSAYFSIYSFDNCTGETLFYLICNNNSLAEEEFQVARRGDSATLNATLTCVDYVTYEPANDVVVDVVWTGDGVDIKSKDMCHFDFPYQNWKAHSANNVQRATLAGIASDGVALFTEFPEGTEGNILSGRWSNVSKNP
jgi:hypothetical protein